MATAFAVSFTLGEAMPPKLFGIRGSEEVI
jgi:hypothetical protein